MGIVKKSTFTLVGMICLFSLFGFSFQKQEEITKEDRKTALADFQNNSEQEWKIRWNEKTGTPHSLLGSKITRYQGTPKQISRVFLNDEKLIFGIKNAQDDLEIVNENYTENGGTKLTFGQKYNNVPVLDSGYLVAVDNNGAIYLCDR